MGSVSPLVLARPLQIKTFKRVILSVLPVRGAQCWRNTCKVNIYRCECQAGRGLVANDLLCLCARLTSRWRPRSLSLEESRVTYFAITRVFHWVGMCMVNGWQLRCYKFTAKFIPVNQFSCSGQEAMVPFNPCPRRTGRLKMPLQNKSSPERGSKREFLSAS